MTGLIEQRVELARQGRNPWVVSKMRSGWVVIGDVQPLAGYCLLLADPVVESLNALGEADLAQFCSDMSRVGQALLAVTDAYRINYEIWGNLDPALHAHITPRFRTEPEAQRQRPACVAYDFAAARVFDPAADGPLIERLRRALESPR